ncbi:uncharacterized protein LOC131858256 [Cryptomeria japonica]|uniref:uncharacterized protein LOC131858256 n=1 Tax=Cryptomeria japonica TaxID=3369 RepID=UPI0027DA2EEB|nr:uncharacterized protein LOC131858256 [Cryptomeria japonica]
MDREGSSASKAPLFDGTDYAFWKVRMQTYLIFLGVDVWTVVFNGYIVPQSIPIDHDGKKEYENDTKAKHAILCGLSKDVFVKIMHCRSSKQVWDKLKNSYHGNDKVKQAKIQTLRAKFEGMKMSDEERVADYFLRVDEIVNAIRGLEEDIEDKDVAKKVLRSLPSRYDSKLSAIKELKDLNTLTVDDLHGTLIAYEMRTCGEEIVHRKIGHFAANFALDDSDKENSESFTKQRTFIKKKKIPFKAKKSLYAKGDVTNNNSEVSVDDESKVLFMTTECPAGNQVLDDVV